jgi:PAS domain S-box-containing protein
MNKFFSRIFSTQDGEPGSEAATRARNTFAISVVILIATLISATAALVFYIQQPAWQLVAIMISMLVTSALSGLALWMARSGQGKRAATLMVATTIIAPLSIAVVISGLGSLLALAVLVAIIQLGIASFPPAALNRVIIIALVAGVVTGLTDVLLGAIQLQLPTFQIIVNVLAGLIVLTLLAFGARQFSSYPLFAKLLLVILLVTLIPIIAITYINTQTSRQNLTDAADKELGSAASETAQELDGFIQDNLNLVRANSQLHVLAEYLTTPPNERIGSELETLLNTDLRALARLDQTYITSVALLDKNGRDVADTFLSEVGENKSDRDYFTEAVKNGLPYVSPVEFSKTTGKSSIYFSAPVRDANENIVGVLRIRYSADVLQQLVKTNAASFAGADAFAVLYDENFIRLAHSDAPELILKSVVPLPADKLAQLQAELRMPPGSAEELSSNLPDAQKALENIENQPSFETNFASTPGTGLDYAVGTRLKNQPWTIVFVQTEATFLAPVQTETRNSLVIALVVAGLVSFVAFFVGQLISRPIVQLTSVAQEIAAGKPNVQASVTSTDEIGALAGAFNTMTAQLTRRASDLATVAEVSTATSTVLEVDKLLKDVVELTKERFRLYHSHIYLLDEDGTNLVLTAGAGEVGKQMVSEKRSIPLDREQSLVARAARDRKGVTVNDVRQAPDFLANPLLPDTRSELAVPMIVADRLLGVFDVQSDQVGRFGDLDVSIQTTMASQIAVSIQNANQVQETIALAAELSGFQGAVSEAAIIATTDVQGKILEVNDNFVRISKYAREELLGQDHRLLNSGYHPKEFIRDLWVTIANGKVWRNEIKNKAKDGSYYWVDTTISPVLNAQGKPFRYVAVRFDITARKEFELAAARRAVTAQALDTITQKIQGATKIEAALQIAARELGHALGMKQTRVEIEPAKDDRQAKAQKENV